MRLLLFVLALCGLCGPARADVSGTWRDESGAVSMIVEAADNGNARLEFVGRPYYLLIRGGEVYMVFTTQPGILVARLADLERMVAERFPNLALSLDIVRTGDLVDRGQANVQGRTGTAYHLVVNGVAASQAAVTISRDPTLAPLAPPFLRQIDLSIALIRIGNRAVPPSVLRLREILAGGAPLTFAGSRLDRVATTRIDPKRFALPVLPQSYEQLRAGPSPLASMR
jgi:hypothetical protein